ncbi:hypothetical protein HGA11_05800 [Mycolicibacterium septicum DSM 44393]|uniref:Cadherin domain-containing protein n=1 Tax=Mycolicibacterium septicum DSM 44393 TaxID=1341646 RepID=A0A7X6MKK1_9MYCO|nr:hypothetical protein [Mycolicibacterium septicum DSM 44393]
MNASNPLVNPLFASPSSSAPASPTPARRTTQTTARIGAYSGIVVTGWLVAAVASGYGVAAAETTGTSSPDSSTSSSANSASSTEASTVSDDAKKGASPVGKNSAKKATKPKRTGKTSTTKELAPGVTISSSGGARATDSDIESTGAQKEPGKPRGLAEAVDAHVDALSSIPDKVRSTVLGLTEGKGRPALSMPDSAASVASARTSDNASPLTPVGPVRLTDTLKRSLAKVERVTEQVTERVSERVSDKITESDVVSAANEVQTQFASGAAKMQTATAAVAGPVAKVAATTDDPVGILNGIVTDLLNPFLAPAPDSPEPFTPMMWAALAWVRRNAFNQSPTVSSDPVTTVQTGQTVTGNIGATDAEGDELTYTVTEQPKYGTVTIDQKTGEFTYTPNDIDYEAAQEDSFTVSVTDGEKVNLLSFFKPRTAQKEVDVTVLSPTIERVILNMPDGIKNPNTPRFAEDGKSIYFAATPPAGGRQEIYQISVDGSKVECITCGVSPEISQGLSRVVPFQDGSGRLMIQVATSPNYYVVYEDTANGRQLVPVVTPPSGSRALDPQREMRISPDGTHVLFSQIQMGQGGTITAVPVVGKLTRTTNATTGAAEYHIDDARVVYPVGEGKQWTPDGKGVIILGGTYEAGGVDDIVVDLETGEVTRLTANPEYDEDIDMSPNGQWIAVGSTRGYHALSPMTRIDRPAFLPAYIQGTVYTAYAGDSNYHNVSNQEWAVAVEDELKGENGIPLFADNDGYTARSMASWNADGTAVTFWEAGETDTRLVVANLKYTTSTGPVAGDMTTPDPDWAPKLDTYVATNAPLPATGTYAGDGGGTAVVSEVTDPTTGHIVRTVTYTDYVNKDGMILNGTESTDTTASQASVAYKADITVTGAHTGYLKADANINKLTRTMTGYITSDVDGDEQSLLDPNDIDDARDNV